MDIEKVGESGLSKAVVAALAAMRDAMTNDPLLRERLSEAGEQEIAGVLEDKFWDRFPEGELRAAAREAAAEVIRMRADPGTYLMDPASGRSLFKLTPDMIYSPPDSFTEDGKPRKQLAMLHPRLSSGLALAAHERSRESAMVKSVPDGMGEAVAHLRDPWRIVEHASARLASDGIPVSGGADDLPEEAVLEVGREQIDGITQSPNFGFHRSVAYGASVARKVAGLGARRCCFVSVDKRRGPKQSWFDVRVRYATA